MTNVWFVTWSAADWSAFGTVVAAIANVVLAIGASFAALRAVYLYKESKRTEAAHWLQSMFEQFYLSDEFLTARSLLQYEYKDSVAPLLERRLTDRDVPRTLRQAEILHEVDRLLNYFEWILYLEHNEHLAKDDRLALFRYWFDLMKHSDKGALRRYCATWDWERLSHELASDDGVGTDGKQPAYQISEYVAVYGSLMSDLAPEDAPHFTEYFDFFGACTIEGCLYDLGSYPGLVAGEGSVNGELYRLKFPLSDSRSVQAFRALDKFERFDAHKARESLYVRQVVRLKEPANLDVWVYMYNRQTRDLPLVPHGDWREHIRQRNAAPMNDEIKGPGPRGENMTM
ncbi:gamma-glutamylcyclotransferase [Pseudarthrobacter sp. H3Y2-7]|uniref:gamma-glutamylcyclotransferase family protein n=1 Tax=Pseudarthrobacter naphthalenicus TaxID=3031328 RepID=UPI0023B205EF|nr:gamma-glutamylcyclotransferase family protein [Pseudarthrobacter sp. H3Y2-7]MDE8668416.1 gamma-glutamylcyclotransferase [Pseudarthrobacter sp. H3Y2-7]